MQIDGRVSCLQIACDMTGNEEIVTILVKEAPNQVNEAPVSICIIYIYYIPILTYLNSHTTTYLSTL